jgi:hypothetical protein
MSPCRPAPLASVTEIAYRSDQPFVPFEKRAVIIGWNVWSPGWRGR